MNVYEFVIKEENEERLDKFLTQHINEISRSKIQEAIKNGQVLVNNESVKANYKLKKEDQVWMEYEEEVLELVSEEIPLDILYEDEALFVLNKPAGLVMHPAPGHPEGTLVNACLLIPQLSDINGSSGRASSAWIRIHRVFFWWLKQMSP